MNRMRRIGTNLLGALCVAGFVGSVEARSVIPSATPWVIESAEYTGKVTEQIARLQALLTVEVIHDGWIQIPLTLSGGTITHVELTKKVGEAHIVPDPGHTGQYLLTASRKGTYKVQVEFSTRLYQDSQHEGVIFGIPQASFSTLSLEVPRKDVELREGDKLYVERKPDGKEGGVTLIARLAAAQAVLRGGRS